MNVNLKQLAYRWITAESKNVNITDEYYCQMQDIFEAKNNKMLDILLRCGINENKAYLILAVVGEIGNNSFDHNLGNWPDIMGIFFGYKIKNKKVKIILADRGRGILATLKQVIPNLKNDQEALEIAFTKKISGRAFENRGNGLKFVKQNIECKKLHLEFQSGKAKIEINSKMKISLADDFINGCLAILTI